MKREETFEKLIELQHLMGAAHHQRMMEHGPMADATRGMGRVLALLKMKDGIATKDMANVLGIRVSSLNETLARLEADGYIERRQSESDGRIMLVYLTDKGHAAEQPANNLVDLVFKDFEDSELDILRDYLERMTNSIEAELGPNWRDQMQHMRHRREQIFKQAHGRGHERGGMHGHAGGRPHRYDAFFSQPAMRDSHPSWEINHETCAHDCNACTLRICTRTGRPRH